MKIMSIDDATPEEWNKLRQPECELTRPEVPYAPSPDGYDVIEKPMHYDGQVECIEYIRDRLGHEGFIAYCWGSVIKYQHRWKEKGGIDSLRKARWFLNRLIQEEATGRFDG
jgi:hypothetical protein